MSKLKSFFNQFGKNEPETENDNAVDSGNDKNAPTDDNKQPENTEERKNSTGNKAHIYNLIIVDESGSMSHLREATLSGINETINTIRSAQEEFAETQEHRLTLVTFDSGANRPDVRTMIDNQPIAEVREFSDYMPHGWTPLYDAMGQSLTNGRTGECVS